GAVGRATGGGAAGERGDRAGDLRRRAGAPHPPVVRPAGEPGSFRRAARLGPGGTTVRLRGAPARAVRLGTVHAPRGRPAAGRELDAYGGIRGPEAGVILAERILFVGAHCDDI